MCPDLRLRMGGTPQRAEWYQNWLDQWKLAGDPEIVEWPEPDQEQFPLGECKSSYVITREKQNIDSVPTKGLKSDILGSGQTARVAD